jgi:uncharacterized membrane protein HdeD (DUF308 family)
MNRFAIRWLPLALRGLAAVLFGVVTLLLPTVTLEVLIALFGAYALADGVFSLICAARAGRPDRGRWMLVLNGLTSLLVGAITFAAPRLTAFALLYVVAAWAVVTGMLEVAEAVELRRAVRNEWILGFSGIASIVFGALLFTSPVAGVLAVVLWLGVYEVLFGGLLIALALRVRTWIRSGVLPATA